MLTGAFTEFVDNDSFSHRYYNFQYLKNLTIYLIEHDSILFDLMFAKEKGKLPTQEEKKEFLVELKKMNLRWM